MDTKLKAYALFFLPSTQSFVLIYANSMNKNIATYPIAYTPFNYQRTDFMNKPVGIMKSTTNIYYTGVGSFPYPTVGYGYVTSYDAT